TGLLLALATVLLGANAWMHPARGERPSNELLAGDLVALQEQGEPAPATPPGQAEGNKMAVSGRVRDPDGKPPPGAAVAVTARKGLFLCSWEGWAAHRNEVLGQGLTDAEGRFRLVVPRTDPNMTVRNLRVVATAATFGLAWKAIDPNAEQAEAEVRL